MLERWDQTVLYLTSHPQLPQFPLCRPARRQLALFEVKERSVDIHCQAMSNLSTEELQLVYHQVGIGEEGVWLLRRALQELGKRCEEVGWHLWLK